MGNSTLAETTKFYDTFKDSQVKVGVNARHYYIFRHLINAGLKKHHQVLEIGCGIGTLTTLLHSYIKKGKITAVDISPVSIDHAKSIFKNASNVEFLVSDMKDFVSETKFDFVVLPDVLEHIPVGDHPNLFKVLHKITHQYSIIVIHIPHPDMIIYYHKHKPEALQIIDQPLHTDQLMSAVYGNGFKLEYLRSYSIFDNIHDYQLLLLKQKGEHVKIEPMPKWKIIFKKTMLRFFYWFNLI